MGLAKVAIHILEFMRKHATSGLMLTIVFFYIKLRHDIRLRDRDYLRKEIYEPLYQLLVKTKNELSGSWMVDHRTVTALCSMRDDGRLEAIGRIGAKLRTLAGLLPVLSTSHQKWLQELWSELTGEINKHKASTDHQLLMRIGWADLYANNWKTDPLHEQGDVIIDVPIEGSLGAYRGIRFYQDQIEGPWDEVFKRIRLKLRTNVYISNHCEKREEALKVIDNLLLVVAKRKIYPFGVTDLLLFRA
jgi:hypothetical protein